MSEPLLTPEAINYYYDHADEFIYDQIIWPARKFIPEADMTHHQVAAAKEISKYNRVSIESGHGTGKSTVYAWIGQWFLTTRHSTVGGLTKIPCIAPTLHQLQDILWPEFRRWMTISRLKPLYAIQSEDIYIVGHKDRSFIKSRAAREPDSVQGFHAEHLLWLCDEAFGITKDPIWETIEGSFTEPDNKIIMAGQHTVLVGYCHDAFHKDATFWRNLRFNSEESPLAKPEYAERIARKYGKDSDIYRVRVKGMEPKGNPQALISFTDSEAARKREIDGYGSIRMGVDPARFGDDLTVVTIAHGRKVLEQTTLSHSDTDQIVDLTLQTLRKWRKSTGVQSRCDIRIDDTGGWGAGAIDVLRKNTKDNIRVIPVNFGGSGNDEYDNAVSAMWGNLKDIISSIQIPDDDFLSEELSTRQYKFTSDQKITIESKADFKKRYGASPDRADSLVLCMSEIEPNKYFFADAFNPAKNKEQPYMLQQSFAETRLYGSLAGRSFGLWLIDDSNTIHRILSVYEPNMTVKEHATACLNAIKACKYTRGVLPVKVWADEDLRKQEKKGATFAACPLDAYDSLFRTSIRSVVFETANNNVSGADVMRMVLKGENGTPGCFYFDGDNEIFERALLGALCSQSDDMKYADGLLSAVVTEAKYGIVGCHSQIALKKQSDPAQQAALAHNNQVAKTDWYNL